MKKTWRVMVVTLLIGCCAQRMAGAANVGDQIFPKDLKGKARSGVVYDNVRREVDVTSGAGTLDKVEYDAVYLRVNTDVGEVASLDFDLGGADPSGGDFTYYVGLGLRLLAYDSDQMRLTMMAQIHYTPLETKEAGVKYDYDLIEGEAGLFIAGKRKIEKQLTLMPYVGPVFSIVRLDGDAGGGATKSGFDAEENTKIGVAAGASVLLSEQHSMQAEVRYFDDFNFSLGIAIAF